MTRRWKYRHRITGSPVGVEVTAPPKHGYPYYLGAVRVGATQIAARTPGDARCLACKPKEE